MSPYRSPSPFQDSEPGDALLSSSISLGEISAISVPVPGPASEFKPRKGDIILLQTEHMCPTETNGKTACRACYEKAAELLKKLRAEIGGNKAVKSDVQAAAKAGVEISFPEDESISAILGGGLGTFSLSTKKALFDEALFGLDSMSALLYIKAVAERETEGSVVDVIREVERLGLLHSDQGDGDEGAYDHTVGGESGGQMSGFILINVYNDLSGDGQAYLQMHELGDNDNDHQGDLDVLFSGAGF